MGELRIIDGSGDIRVAWDPENQDEVDAVRKQFEELKAKGYKFFRVGEGAGDDPNGDGDFVPMAGKAIFAKPMAVTEKSEKALVPACECGHRADEHQDTVRECDAPGCPCKKYVVKVEAAPPPQPVKPSEPIKEFDPKDKAVVATPIARGG